MLDFATTAPLLRAVGMSQAGSEPLDVVTLGSELDRSVDVLETELDALEQAGLMILSPSLDGPALLLRAGRQYLRRGGDVQPEVLAFLPHTIDDLVAREALLTAGTIVVDEFRTALLHGRAVEHAVELVPEAFTEAITHQMAIDLFAAAVALMVRLSHGEAAGSVAEEIVAVAVIDEASTVIELEADDRGLTDEDVNEAIGQLRSLFELFQDDDVLNLFDMQEPGDAALQGHSDLSRQLGVVDQRVEAWFTPFGGVAPTGYLHERPGDR